MGRMDGMPKLMQRGKKKKQEEKKRGSVQRINLTGQSPLILVPSPCCRL